MENVSTDAYPWVKFSFYPCPVGASDPSGCKKNPGPFPGVNPNCCINDKFEDCLVHKLQCFYNTSCPFDSMHKLSKFLFCFEGSVIAEGQCPGNASKCMTYAGMGSLYNEIAACVQDPAQMQVAASAMEGRCTAEKVPSWPDVHINGVRTCEDDSCFIPLLPYLCQAYKSTPKPKSCQRLEQQMLSEEIALAQPRRASRHGHTLD